jgi:uncharacterized RDD family membrane protein YckC
MEAGPPPNQERPQAPPGQAPPAPRGQMPPGGWQYPVAPPKPVWAGPPLASWGSRVGATLLDGLVIFVLLIALIAPGVLLLIAEATAAGIILLVLGGLAYFAVTVLYGGWLMKRPGERNGQTLGKQWVGIRVVRDGGQQFDLGSGLLREFVIKQALFGWVGSAFGGIPGLVDVLWPLWEDENGRSTT